MGRDGVAFFYYYFKKPKRIHAPWRLRGKAYANLIPDIPEKMIRKQFFIPYDLLLVIFS